MNSQVDTGQQMIFIRDRLTFEVTKQTRMLGCDPLVYDALEDTTSQISVPISGITSDDINCWATIGNGLWLIKGISQQDTYTDVTLEPPWRLFARDHIWNGGEYSTKAQFLVYVIQQDYIYQSDYFYAYKYMSVYSADTDADPVAFEEPADEVGDIYSFSEYLETAVKRDRLYFQPIINGNKLAIRICKREGVVRTVVFNDGHTIYEGASFGDKSVGKVTILQNGSTTDYWLDSSSNEPVTMPPNERVSGEWKLISIGEDDDPATEAENEFKDTIESYKIEWASDQEFNVGDTVRFRLPDESTHYGEVTYKSKKTSDGLFHYKSGTLRTTLTDKLRSVS